MRRNSKSKKAQGSLEYLIILASVLAVSAIVVLFMSGTFGTTGADVSGCKSAAGTCAAKLVTTYSPPCPACDTACVDSSGKDMMSKTTGCGGACTLCKLGEPMRISSSGWQPHELEPDSSTAGLWHANEGGGGSITDSSGNGNAGAINGTTWNSSGKFGYGLTFDGVNDNVSVSHSSSLTTPDSFTVELWFKVNGPGPAGKNYWTMILKNPTGSGFNDLYHLSISNTYVFQARVGNGSVEYGLSSINVNDGKFHHGALVFDNAADSYFLYLDGAAVSNQSVPPSWIPAQNTGPIFLGTYSLYFNYFSGTIDEVAISNRAKSDAEIWVDANA